MLRFFRLFIGLLVGLLISGFSAKAESCLQKFSCKIGGECRLPCFDAVPAAPEPVDLHVVSVGASTETEPQAQQQTDPLQELRSVESESIGEKAPPLPVQRERKHRSKPVIVARDAELTRHKKDRSPGVKIAVSFGAATRSERAGRKLAISQTNPPDRTVDAGQARLHSATPKASPEIPRPSVGNSVAEKPPVDGPTPIYWAAIQKRLKKGLDPRVSIESDTPPATRQIDGPRIAESGQTGKSPTFGSSRGDPKSLLDAMPGDRAGDLFSEPTVADATAKSARSRKKKAHDSNDGKDIPATF